MSATVTEPLLPVEQESIALADAEYGDESKIRELLTPLADALRKAIKSARADATAKAQVAYIRANLRRFVIWKGQPDWNGDSALYKALLANVQNAVYEAMKVETQERNNLEAAIRQHVNRNQLPAVIAQYVKETHNGMGEKDSSDPGFSALVAAEFDRAGLKVPKDYLPPAPPDESKTGAPPAPVSAFAGATETATAPGVVASTVAPLVVLKGIHRLMSAEIAHLMAVKDKEPGITDRPKVLETLDTLQSLIVYGTKAVQGEASEEELKKLEGFYFNPSA